MKSITINVTLPYNTIARMLIAACENDSKSWLGHVDVRIDDDADVMLPAASRRDEIIGDSLHSPRVRGRRGWPLYAVAPFITGMRLALSNTHDGRIMEVGRAEIAAAAQLLAEQHPQIFGEVLAGTWTAEHADVFLQLAAFGKVRYPS